MHPEKDEAQSVFLIYLGAMDLWSLLRFGTKHPNAGYHAHGHYQIAAASRT